MPGERGPAREGSDVRHVGGAHHPRVVDGDVLEDPGEVHVLLGVRVNEVTEVVARDREDRCAIQLCVVEAVHEVQPARPGRREADAQAARELRVRGRRKRGRLLVSDLDKADLVLVRPKGLHQPVDPVARKAEDGVDAPVDERLDECVSGGSGHGSLLRG